MAKALNHASYCTGSCLLPWTVMHKQQSLPKLFTAIDCDAQIAILTSVPHCHGL
jgi:hypothetical protein